MTYGPVDFLAIEFKGNHFKGELMPALLDLVNNEIIHIIDLVIVQKDANGTVSMQEMQQHDNAMLSLFDPRRAEVTGMIQRDDLEMIGEKIENNSTAAVLLFEHLWAIKFKQAVLNANGRVLMQERIPHEVVDEVEKAISDIGKDELET